MFKLFRNKPESTDNSPVVETKTKEYPAVVKEIHNEFFTAGDNILEEATCLLKELETHDLAKGKRLVSLGFNKTREASVVIEIQNKLSLTKEISELVVYYQRYYPNNKFITEKQVKYICEKYGLVCGDISMYKGFVPENKLKLIEQFKIKDADKGLLLSNGVFLVDAEVRENPHSAGYLHIYKRSEPSNSHNYAWQADKGRPERGFYSHDRADIFNVGSTVTDFTISECFLKICAPLKDMDIPPTKEIVGYKITDKPIPDPVVLHPVKGGYLILAAWGDEASDEIVVNQQMN